MAESQGDHSVRTAIVTDIPLGGDEREDIQFIEECLRDYGQLPIKVVYTAINMSKLPDGGLDLLVIDYGGIAAGGASTVAESALRYVRNWATEHPSCIIVLWTKFTVLVYAWVEEDFGEVANVWYDGDHKKSYVSPKERKYVTDDDWPIYLRLRAYFGVEYSPGWSVIETSELVTPGRGTVLDWREDNG